MLSKKEYKEKFATELKKEYATYVTAVKKPLTFAKYSDNRYASYVTEEQDIRKHDEFMNYSEPDDFFADDVWS